MATSDVSGKRLALLELQRHLTRAGQGGEAAPPRGGGTTAARRDRLRELQQRAAAGAPPAKHGGPDDEPVAIVGMHGRLPGADSIREFWQNLEHEKVCLSEIPAERFDWRTYYDPTGDGAGKMRTRWGGFLSDIKSFDYEFFSVLAREAELIDPQQRLLLASAYHAVEDAGYASDSLRGARVGVYVGVEDNEFLHYLREERIDLGVNGFNHHPSMSANRISHYFDLRGPSEIVNTMCSAAAVAVHRACRAIQTAEIEMALVGSARVVLSPEPIIALSRMKVLSPVGAVKSFGRDADGYLRAEGVGSLVLKSLRRAEADGDHVYAVIRGSATNFNGRGGMSMAAPNRAAHAAVIRECYERAGVDPADVDYIEAQGMGNQVGDIAEWEACNRALEQMYQARGRAPTPGACRVSTVKPMIGHMECMSALGALFKIVGSLKANRIYGIHGLEEVNPYLDTAGRPCRLLRRAEPWSPRVRPRLAGLHSYGSGGSNAHLLIEEYLAPGRAGAAPVGSAPREHLFVFSAPDEDRLRETLRQFAAHVGQTPGLAPADVAFTLLCGRKRFARRLAIVANSLRRLMAEVEAYVRDEPGATGVGAPGAAPTALAQAGRRWLAGESLDAAEIGLVGRGRRVSLPGYPFRRTQCWPAHAAGADAEPRSSSRVSAQTSGSRAGVASLEATITQVLADLLRLEPSAVRVDKDFAAYGFDSITLVWFAAKLAETFPATRLPATTFLEHPTVAALAAHLARELGVGAQAPSHASAPNGGRAAAKRGAPEAYGDLQLLNGDRGVSAFWFHGALGTVQNFLPLAKEMGKNVRFYGVQSRAVRERIDVPADLTALARSYCDLLLEANANSPFHLGGYSQGGALAVEVARRLQRLGRTVKSVVMVDTPFPPIGSRFSEQFNHVLAFANILQINGRKVADEMPELLRRIDGRENYWDEMLGYGVTRGLGRDREELARILRKFYEITRANVRSMEGHAMAPLEPGGDAEFHLFQRGAPGAFFSRALCTLEEARRHNRYFAVNDCAGKWCGVIPGLQLHPTAAVDHFSILEEGGALAAIAQTCRHLYAPASRLGAEQMAL